MLKKNEIKVGDTYSEKIVEDLKRTQIVPVSYTHLTLPTTPYV